MAARERKKVEAKPAKAKGKPAGQADKPAKSAAKPMKGQPGKDKPYLVVAVGASAGGLDALKELFEHVEPGQNLSFLVMQHRKAGDSLLSEILRRHSALPVEDVENEAALEVGRVYILYPDRDYRLDGVILRSQPVPQTPGLRLPIDSLFRNLAKSLGDRLAAVILSGAGADGSLGLIDVKVGGGMILAQDPGTAAHGDMPRSAINTGLVDAEMAPAEMPQLLADHARHYPLKAAEEAIAPKTLSEIISRLRDMVGHDFSNYKTSTIRRRILRRLDLRKISSPEVYAKQLLEDPTEVQQLFRDLLIGVTSFFRDPGAFEHLKKALEEALRDKARSGEPFRAWVPGCSNGEEAYSVAIIVREILDVTGRSVPVQIFATDLSAAAIETARKGVYPGNVAGDIARERLDRHFVVQDGLCRVRKEIREMTIFAVQNVLQDPPFSGLDLICCRNLLIYLNAEAQRRTLQLFHYALNESGLLFLGTSESADPNADLYSPVDKQWRIFRRKPGGDLNRRQISLLRHLSTPWATRGEIRSADAAVTLPSFKGVTEEFLLTRVAPAAVLVNVAGEILYIHGRTGKYLEPPAGEPTRSIQSMARDGLGTDLSMAITQAGIRREDVARQGIRVKTNGDWERVDLLVRIVPTADAEQPLLAVMFSPSSGSGEEATQADAVTQHSDDRRQRELEGEITRLRETLQTTIEEYETTNEEMKSANEELLSTNEELQSTIEELETTKEEMYSSNEELTTVNAELKSRLDELDHVNNDLANLLSSTDFAILYLDSELRIKRYTPPVTNIFNLIPTDLGRPLSHVVARTEYRGLSSDAARVIETLKPVEVELMCEDDTWYRARIKPYMTLDKVFDGVVVSFVDITELRKAQARLEDEARGARELSENIVDSVRESLAVLDGEFRVKSANRSFCEMFGVSQKDALGRVIFDLGRGVFDISQLKNLLLKIIPERYKVEDYGLNYSPPQGARRRLVLSARQLTQPAGSAAKILLVVHQEARSAEESACPPPDAETRYGPS